MVKVRSLDHTRFVIVTTSGEESRTMYYAGGRGIGNRIGDWSTDLGGAKVYNNLIEAKKLMIEIRDHYNNTLTSIGTARLDFDVSLVEKKEVMIARLKYNGETI